MPHQIARVVGSARLALPFVLAAAIMAAAFDAIAADAPIGTQPFTNHRDPPPYRKLSDAELARYDLGMTVFNTHFVVAGTPGAGRRDGVGPLFNSSSCDGCHNNGAHGRGPTGDGPAPQALVVQLATASQSTDSADPPGDPVYGQVFNTVALDGVVPEGVVMIRYEESTGHYPDGAAWSLRVPHYTLTNLRYGALATQTIVKPRLAPALFGVGLLDAAQGHFGWQGSATSLRDQTARAFAREMGLTSADIGHDDCTPTQTDCLHQPNGGTPEVSADLFDAVVSFERWLAVPASRAPHPQPDPGINLFAHLGCAGCHQPHLSVATTIIAPYTDLRLHDLGTRLADENVGGHKVATKWRTAPLWGLGYRVAFERRFPTFLHDGRARSVEEAILWHDGEAGDARQRFEKLPARQRQAFLHWLETL